MTGKSPGFQQLVNDLSEKSETLLSHLKEADGRNHYEDAFIEKIQRLLAERQTVIDALLETAESEGDLKTWAAANLSKEERASLIAVEKTIAERLRQILLKIQQSRQLLHQKQRTSQHYRHPYSNIPRDGMFIDQRK
jgi:predicted transcriptional regulator